MNKSNLKLEFENNPSKNYIVTYLDNIDCIVDYEVEMINNNPTSGALNIEIRQFNDKIKVLYDATGRIPIKEYLKGRTIRKSEFITILKNIAVCLLECKNYFLDEKKFLMDLETIFISEKDFSVNLLYLPFELITEEDINVTYRNLVKSLIIDFVSIEEKTSENIIQETLKYLRKDDFNLVGFKNYLESSETSGIKVVDAPESNIQNKVESVPVRIENEPIQEEVVKEPVVHHEIKPSNIDVTQNKSEEFNTDSNLKSKKVEVKSNTTGNKKRKILYIVISQVIAAAIIGIEVAFILKMLFMIIAIAVVVAVDVALVIFILLRGNKVETVADKRRANTSFIKRDKEAKESKPSKREIVTEMSYETELLDSKTAFLMSKKAGTVERIFINKDSFKIGRISGQADYISDNKAVGKLHAEIRKQNEKYYLIDLTSRNGTFVNGQKINSDELYEIRNGDTIMFANSEFTFAIE
ncbi:pSer/pThr/pTyr-binding forkhead associated (FHA) protein [Clostridium acetobutylicum]|uniref:Predicted membrane protein, containing FHA domain n=1 Tax=Clostridium acetobutylicum (strain ATCC 824 / DSM 792 / JCM 1419 / IAM 19013 / LMG 5710 / NBRC 13948 / NRRL B-527 / VKM B-1787 / 2291 / W) TaxID=272562 RepID=Q97N03_CLOAB|nr:MULTISPECIES: DUF6382 domain-containing protein [Clostridium]AAK78023.1 Predicted membrane protein, containing FHA domain [Clostridium acetobutylicum ATCC 824]ADZ19079.1 membrane protein, containing FHA domain [Clostridium acetobutylicum EA 2018]AEI31020.1 FHA domain-containing protein [Clostridium acetobutylicum DSM 1731]AWV81914.1 phosphopeptide-binding protein [Clostridium acetobutylicum]MBC2395464.1 FHA domain-containing protein [Clostridium acetobutylicum]